MKKLSPPMKIMHWIMAALIIYMLYTGYFKWHKAIGVSLLLLLGFRVALHHFNPPQIKNRSSTLQEHAARAMHALLYILMLAIPVTGLLRTFYAGGKVDFFGLFEMHSFLAIDKGMSGLFREAHEILTNVLWAAITVHILGGLYHHFVLRDDTLRRMIFLDRQ